MLFKKKSPPPISSTMSIHISYLIKSYWLVLNIFHFIKGICLFSIHLVPKKDLKWLLESLSLETDKCFEKMKLENSK